MTKKSVKFNTYKTVISSYLGGLWKEFIDDIKTVHIKNLGQDFDNSLKEFMKTDWWNTVADVIQHTCMIMKHLLSYRMLAAEAQLFTLQAAVVIHINRRF